jgi:hypothetical protein
MDDFNTRRGSLDDERGDSFARASVLRRDIRRARHDHEQVGARPVGAPELLAVQQKVGSVLHRRCGRGHVRRVGPGVHFSQRERTDAATRQSRKETALLLLGTEKLERLRHADRLAGREERGEAAVLRRDHLQRPDVRHLRKTEPTVFARDLDTERTDVAERLHDGFGDLTLAIDLVGVGGREDVAQLVQEIGRARCLIRIILFRMRMNEVKPESAEEELPHKARVLPLCLAGRFGGFASLTLGGEGLGR